MVLIKPLPLENEGARGYVLRLSERNGLESPRWLLSLLSEDAVTPRGHAALGSILGRSEDVLRGVRGPIANLAQLNAPDLGGLPTRYWNTRRPRFCPCCLDESPNWRDSWDLVFTVACDKHGLRLHDRCPQCLRPLSWDRTHVTTCACGFDLRKACTEKAAEATVVLAREFESRLRPDVGQQKRVLEVLLALDLESLLRLVWFLGAYSRNAHRKPQKIVGLETAEVAASMVEKAMEALTDWPLGFHRLLDEIVSRQAPAISSNKLGARFGWFYTALFKSFSEPEFEFLRFGFEEYLRGHWTGQLARRNRRLSADLRSEHEWVSIAEAARLLNMRVGTVGRFLEEGVLQGELHVTKSGRKMSAIRLESLNALMTRKRDWVTLKEARTLLGISRKRAYALLDLGGLNPISGPTVDGKTLWRFQRQDILALKALQEKT